MHSPSSRVVKVIIAGGPDPTLVEAVTLHSYVLYGLSPPTKAIVSINTPVNTGVLVLSVQMMLYEIIIPFLPLSSGRDQARVTFWESMEVVLNASGGTDGSTGGKNSKQRG